MKWFKDNIVKPRIKPHPKTGVKVEEKYIEIPHQKAFPEKTMFDWIEKQIR